ncbi:hypothetical protein ONZ45_g109 [Pleurotus djamor]|nr:hypothetical protein ONZ45_g109 [Pleurotus djamor]
MGPMFSVFPALTLILTSLSFVHADPTRLSIPQTPPTNRVVQSNFLGISFELSFLNDYFGQDVSSTPAAVMNYLRAFRSRTGNLPLRLRVGGNSMDVSTYDPSQQTPMIRLLNSSENPDRIPANFGPALWQVMNKVADDVGGAQYLVGLSIVDPNSTDIPLLAVDGARELGSNLDSFLLGNEPDLYTSHRLRTDVANYTSTIYSSDFRHVIERLQNTSLGQLTNIGGPTLCCFWDLHTLLQEGYLSANAGNLKYVTMQHYPQNNCVAGKYRYQLPYYTVHANTVELASWNQPGITDVLANTEGNRPQLLLSEFNSIACGGVPGISDTFAVGSLWTVDYSLQLASIGYVATYLHTRERGVTYNILTSPESNPSEWNATPSFYPLLVVAEALGSTHGNGSIVTDLNLSNSTLDPNATVAGYAIHNADDSSLRSVVLFNFANMTAPQNASFEIPSGRFTRALVKYLSAPSAVEKEKISWGGQTYLGTSDGTLVDAPTDWGTGNTILDCTTGCTIGVPGPGLALVIDGEAVTRTAANGGYVVRHSILQIFWVLALWMLRSFL